MQRIDVSFSFFVAIGPLGSPEGSDGSESLALTRPALFDMPSPAMAQFMGNHDGQLAVVREKPHHAFQHPDPRAVDL